MGYLHVFAIYQPVGWSLSINSMTLQKNMGMLHVTGPSDFFQLENGYKINSESIFHKVVVPEFLDGHPQKGGKVITTFKKLTPYIGNQLISQMTDICSFMMLHDMLILFIFSRSHRCGWISWWFPANFPGNWQFFTQQPWKDFSSEPLEQRLKSRDLSRRCSAYSDAQVWSWSCWFLVVGDYDICWFMLPYLKINCLISRKF